MKLDTFSITREVFMIIRRVDAEEEQAKLIDAVFDYIYNDDCYTATGLHYQAAIEAFELIKTLLDKPLQRARKAKARRDDRKAHPEKYPSRKKSAPRKSGAVELPSGHVIESDESETASFDYYCIKGDTVLYFRMVGRGNIAGKDASYNPVYRPDEVLNTILLNASGVPKRDKLFQSDRKFSHNAYSSSIARRNDMIVRNN